ncbi:MAG TPA: dipeptidase [Actinomycetales bacterium]|nr:dipeptidase [Actinomycetales bacterium]
MTGIIDGHNDLPWAMRELCGYDLDRVDLTGSVPQLHTDVPRLRAGGVGGQFWSVFVPSSLAGDAAVVATLEQIDFVRRMVARYPDAFALATTADEVEQAAASGRVASLMGVEGGHSIGESLGVLRMMHALGVRYLTLTHNDNVPWADSATDEPVLGGLNDLGEQVVRELNRLGVLVDLSHVSADTMRHALRVTSAPAIFSHSSARAVCDVPRNAPDDVLETLGSNGGVCMVTFVPAFVSQRWARWYEQCRELVAEQGGDPKRFEDLNPLMLKRAETDPPPLVTVDDVVPHVEHVREVAGVEHVGLGGDFDGSAFMPHDLYDVSCYPRLLDALRDRGWSARDLDGLRSGNVLRVLRAAEEVAA